MQIYRTVFKKSEFLSWYVFSRTLYITVDSNFPPTLWAQPPDLSMPHTNNGAESYHSHLNAEFYAKRPNIYMFVDVLKEIQQSAYASMNSLSQQPART